MTPELLSCGCVKTLRPLKRRASRGLDAVLGQQRGAIRRLAWPASGSTNTGSDRAEVEGYAERRTLGRGYATGLEPRLATLVRGSSRRITTMRLDPRISD